jgi:hypothetical protein
LRERAECRRAPVNAARTRIAGARAALTANIAVNAVHDAVAAGRAALTAVRHTTAMRRNGGAFVTVCLTIASQDARRGASLLPSLPPLTLADPAVAPRLSLYRRR